MMTPPDPLDPLLDRWTDVPPPPERLAALVWQRLATGEHKDAEPAGIWMTLRCWLARPVFALGFVTACVLLGLFLAELRVSRSQRDRSALLARSYLQLIDPLLHDSEGGPRS